MAHNEHNRPRGGGIVLIALGILIFIFAPNYFKSDMVGGAAIMAFGFALGGIGFYISFFKKKNVR